MGTEKLIDDILEGLRLQSSVFSRMTLSGDWGFAKDALSGAPFHLMLAGEAWLRTGQTDEALRLEAGDIAILPGGEPHQLLSQPTANAVPWRSVAETMGWTQWEPGMRFKAVDLRLGTGSSSSTLISGVFAFGDHRRNPLFAALPSVLMLRTTADSAPARTAASLVQLLDAELLSGRPGAESVGARLADILFIQVVRHHLSLGEELPRGWLRGMTDTQIAPALALMQRAPERTWSVATLARELGMSRSAFAARFQDIVAQAPLEYLTHLRMYLAAQRLAEDSISITTLAASFGYSSQISFNKAFKRWAGKTPAEYRRGIALKQHYLEISSALSDT